jgi:hypothetical protein
VGSDFNASPLVVGEIKIDAASMLGDTNVDRSFRSVKLSSGFQMIDGHPDYVRAEGVASRLVMLTSQPGSKVGAPNGPGLSVSIAAISANAIPVAVWNSTVLAARLMSTWVVLI